MGDPIDTRPTGNLGGLLSGGLAYYAGEKGIETAEERGADALAIGEQAGTTAAGTTFLMYDDSSKLATTNTGVTVTGELVATTINGGTF